MSPPPPRLVSSTGHAQIHPAHALTPSARCLCVSATDPLTVSGQGARMGGRPPLFVAAGCYVLLLNNWEHQHLAANARPPPPPQHTHTHTTHQKKLLCTSPTVCVFHPYSWLMGRMAMLMFTLSMLHSMKATKHSSTIVQRRRQPDKPSRNCSTDSHTTCTSSHLRPTTSDSIQITDRCRANTPLQHRTMPCSIFYICPWLLLHCTACCRFMMHNPGCTALPAYAALHRVLCSAAVTVAVVVTIALQYAVPNQCGMYKE
jgi:hypothetical protein